MVAGLRGHGFVAAAGHHVVFITPVIFEAIAEVRFLLHHETQGHGTVGETPRVQLEREAAVDNHRMYLFFSCWSRAHEALQLLRCDLVSLRTDHIDGHWGEGHERGFIAVPHGKPLRQAQLELALAINREIRYLEAIISGREAHVRLPHEWKRSPFSPVP